jgi:uncharacterized protein YaiI (UPF0178 family)
MNSRPSHIVVDADACPVKREIIDTAILYGVPVWMIASHDHRLQAEPGVTVIQVDISDQSVDLYIANCIKPGDILVTQDFGLATIGLSRRAEVLSFRGQAYTEDNIDFLLARRHGLSRQRRGGIRSKGPKAMTREDRECFQQTLTKVLRKRKENSTP